MNDILYAIMQMIELQFLVIYCAIKQSYQCYSDQDSKVGGLSECGISWVSDCSHSSSNPWKNSAYLCWNFMCCINHRHVCITSISYGKLLN